MGEKSFNQSESGNPFSLYIQEDDTKLQLCNYTKPSQTQNIVKFLHNYVCVCWVRRRSDQKTIISYLILSVGEFTM